MCYFHSFCSGCKHKANILSPFCKKVIHFLNFYSWLSHNLREIGLVRDIHGLELGFHQEPHCIFKIVFFWKLKFKILSCFPFLKLVNGSVCTKSSLTKYTGLRCESYCLKRYLLKTPNIMKLLKVFLILFLTLLPQYPSFHISFIHNHFLCKNLISHNCGRPKATQIITI